MKIYRYLFVLILLVCSSQSCQKWLNVSPISTVKADELMKTEEGFHKALIGVYIDMTSSSLYGGNLTLSVLDVLAQTYTTPLKEAKHKYEKFAKYEYTDEKVEPTFDQIWSGLYNCITGCNSIFEHLDIRKNVFSPHYYEVVKGELLALRAMFHFDALRLYVQAPKFGLDVKAIPYVQYFGSDRSQFLTSKVALQYIIRDLETARELLKNNDPIVAEIDLSQSHTNYWEKRQSRMNYYAVTALLARVHLWIGNDVKANEYALEVYNSTAFSLISEKGKEDIEKNKKTLTFRDEHIFGVYVDQLQNNVTKYLFDKNDNSVLAIQDKVAESIYEAGDLRYDMWFEGFGEGGYEKIIKYTKESYVPIIRLPEIILILAETTEDINKAAGYINILKKNRGLSMDESISIFNITDVLLKEYRREFVGEGVVFYQYKRFDRKLLPNDVVLSDTKAVYNLPIPKSELEFAQ